MMGKKFQSVSIWWFPGGYFVRGYYRGASYLIERCATLDEAVRVAFAADRKQHSVALVPAREEIEELANKIVEGGSA